MDYAALGDTLGSHRIVAFKVPLSDVCADILVEKEDNDASHSWKRSS